MKKYIRCGRGRKLFVFVLHSIYRFYIRNPLRNRFRYVLGWSEHFSRSYDHFSIFHQRKNTQKTAKNNKKQQKSTKINKFGKKMKNVASHFCLKIFFFFYTTFNNGWLCMLTRFLVHTDGVTCIFGRFPVNWTFISKYGKNAFFVKKTKKRKTMERK